jgi:hypothetical protein
MIVLCAVQVWRPTLAIWYLLITVFCAALVIVMFAGTATTTDRFVFAALLAVPAIALWNFRPTRDIDSPAT